MSVAIFVIFWIFFLLYIGYGIVQTILPGLSEKYRDDNELNNWLTNTEEKYRDLHTYPEDWGMRRRYIAKRDNFTCNNCGRKGWLGFHIHHKIHLSQGGTNALDNLMYLCKWCHENQHPHMIAERNRKEAELDNIRKKTYWKNYWIRKNNYKKQSS